VPRWCLGRNKRATRNESKTIKQQGKPATKPPNHQPTTSHLIQQHNTMHRLTHSRLNLTVTVLTYLKRCVDTSLENLIGMVTIH